MLILHTTTKEEEDAILSLSVCLTRARVDVTHGTHALVVHYSNVHFSQ